MIKGDKASPRVILAGRALLVEMLIPFEPYYAVGSNFEYLCISTLSSHWENSDKAESSIILAD